MAAKNRALEAIAEALIASDSAALLAAMRRVSVARANGLDAASLLIALPSPTRPYSAWLKAFDKLRNYLT